MYGKPMGVQASMAGLPVFSVRFLVAGSVQTAVGDPVVRLVVNAPQPPQIEMLVVLPITALFRTRFPVLPVLLMRMPDPVL